MAFIKPSTLTFTRSRFNTFGTAIPQGDLRYIVSVDGVASVVEHVATLVGASQASIPLAAELPDAAGDYSVTIKAKNVVNGLVSADSTAVIVTVVDDSEFPPEAPSNLQPS